MDELKNLANRRYEVRRTDTRGPGIAPLLLGIGAAIGAAAAFFFDPQRGAARRAQAIDRVTGLARRTTHGVERLGRRISADAYGMQQKAAHLGSGGEMDLDDATLAAKVESQVFRDPSVPKGDININAEHGVVVLRGEVEDESLISRLENEVRAIAGVRDVQNLLHLPSGTPAG